MHHGSVQDLIDAGILFCGTPDQVYDQIVDFTEYCGGMGNLLMMGHAGFLTHEDTVEQPHAVRQGGDAAAEGLQAAGAGSDRGGVTRRQAVLLRGARRAVLAVATRSLLNSPGIDFLLRRSILMIARSRSSQQRSEIHEQKQQPGLENQVRTAARAGRGADPGRGDFRRPGFDRRPRRADRNRRSSDGAAAGQGPRGNAQADLAIAREVPRRWCSPVRPARRAASWSSASPPRRSIKPADRLLPTS